MKKRVLPLSKVYQLLEPGPVVMVTTQYKDTINIMTMTWHMMVDFVPPLIACVMGEDNFSFELLTKSKECIINIPTVDLAPIAVKVGNVTGKKIDKFKKFGLTPVTVDIVKAPLIAECYANLACRVVNTKLVHPYNIFILEVVKAWISPVVKNPQMFHHRGNGVFAVDGEIIRLPMKKK